MELVLITQFNKLFVTELTTNVSSVSTKVSEKL